MKKEIIALIALLAFSSFAIADTLNIEQANITAATMLTQECYVFIDNETTMYITDSQFKFGDIVSCNIAEENARTTLSKPIKALAKLPVNHVAFTQGYPLLAVGTDNNFYALSLSGQFALLGAAETGINVPASKIDAIEYDYLSAQRGTANLWIILATELPAAGAGSGSTPPTVGNATGSIYTDTASPAESSLPPAKFDMNLITTFSGASADVGDRFDFLITDINGNLVLGKKGTGAAGNYFRYERSAPTLSRTGTLRQVLKPWSSQQYEGQHLGQIVFQNSAVISNVSSEYREYITPVVPSRIVPTFFIKANIRNNGNTTWTTGASTPLDYYDDFRYRVHAIQTPSGKLLWDPVVTGSNLPGTIAPGESINNKQLTILLDQNATFINSSGQRIPTWLNEGPGNYTVYFGMVQESIAWFDNESHVQIAVPGTPTVPEPQIISESGTYTVKGGDGIEVPEVSSRTVLIERMAFANIPGSTEHPAQVVFITSYRNFTYLQEGQDANVLIGGGAEAGSYVNVKVNSININNFDSTLSRASIEVNVVIPERQVITASGSYTVHQMDRIEVPEVSSETVTLSNLYFANPPGSTEHPPEAVFISSARDFTYLQADQNANVLEGSGASAGSYVNVKVKSIRIVPQNPEFSTAEIEVNVVLADTVNFCYTNNTHPVSACATSGETMSACRSSYLAEQNNVTLEDIKRCTDLAKTAPACQQLEGQMRVITNQGTLAVSTGYYSDLFDLDADLDIDRQDVLKLIEDKANGDIQESECSQRVNSVETALLRCGNVTIASCETSAENYSVCATGYFAETVNADAYFRCQDVLVAKAAPCTQLEGFLRVVVQNGNSELAQGVYPTAVFNAFNVNADTKISSADVLAVINGSLTRAQCSERMLTLLTYPGLIKYQ